MPVFNRTFDEILEAILNSALTPEMCKEIIRKSQFRPGGDTSIDPEDIEPWFPHGGYPGDFFSLDYQTQGVSQKSRWKWNTPSWLWAKLVRKAIEAEPDFYIGKYFPLGTYTRSNQPGLPGGVQSEMNYMGLGRVDLGSQSYGGVGRDRPTLGNVPHHFYRLSVRNARHAVGPNPYPSILPLGPQQFGNYVPQPQPDQRFHEEIWKGETRKELLRWDNIPVGTWHFPYNVDWFITKRDFSARYHQNRGRQIKLRTGWVQGNPPASLHLRYSTSGGDGPWYELISVDLQGGGIRNSGWQPFPEGNAAADVHLGLFIVVRSPIARLDMSQVDGYMRWDPIDFRDMIDYDEFGNAPHQPKGSQTLTFSMASPGRLTPGPGSPPRFYYMNYKMAPASEQYIPYTPYGGTSVLRELEGFWNRFPGGPPGGAPGWASAWILPHNTNSARLTVQFVQSLGGNQEYSLTADGGGWRLKIPWDTLAPNGPNDANWTGNMHHIHGHVWFGAQHSGDGIMRPLSERGNADYWNRQGIGSPNENDVYSVYRWLWEGDPSKPFGEEPDPNTPLDANSLILFNRAAPYLLTYENGQWFADWKVGPTNYGFSQSEVQTIYAGVFNDPRGLIRAGITPRYTTNARVAVSLREDSFFPAGVYGNTAVSETPVEMRIRSSSVQPGVGYHQSINHEAIHAWMWGTHTGNGIMVGPTTDGWYTDSDIASIMAWKAEYTG